MGRQSGHWGLGLQNDVFWEQLECEQGAVAAEMGVPPSAWHGQVKFPEVAVQLSCPWKMIVLCRWNLTGLCSFSTYLLHTLFNISWPYSNFLLSSQDNLWAVGAVPRDRAVAVNGRQSCFQGAACIRLRGVIEVWTPYLHSVRGALKEINMLK